MGLWDWIHNFVAGDDTDTDTVAYRCERCPTIFEEDAMKMTQVQCPECGSTRVKTVEEDKLGEK